jgi:hypothetical protein
MISLISCGPGANSSSGASDTFQMHIGVWPGEFPGFTVESSWQPLIEWYEEGATLIIETEDIDHYDWVRHEIFLTDDAAGEYYAIDRLSRATLSWPAFVVTINGEPIYGGIFLFRGSAMGIDYPVIYAETKNERIAFVIRPRHSVLDLPPNEEWGAIADPRIKLIMSNAGKLE